MVKDRNEMPDQEIIIYGTEWCIDCRRARQFFARHNIVHRWVNIDKDRQAEKYVLTVNKGMRSVPTIVFPDGSVLVEPRNQQLAEKLAVPIGF
jgi:mycoredoxin